MTISKAASIIKSYEQGDGSPVPQRDERTVRCLCLAKCCRVGRGLTEHRSDGVRGCVQQRPRMCRLQTVRHRPAHRPGLPGAVRTKFGIMYKYPISGTDPKKDMGNPDPKAAKMCLVLLLQRRKGSAGTAAKSARICGNGLSGVLPQGGQKASFHPCKQGKSADLTALSCRNDIENLHK